MEYKEFDEQFPDNILENKSRSENNALDDLPLKLLIDHADLSEVNLFKLKDRIDMIEKKIGSMKISSADVRASKTFAKDIFKNVVQQGLDDISVRLRRVEENIVQGDSETTVRLSSVERKVSENKQKIDGLTGITYTLVVMNFIHLLIAGIITTGRALAKAVRVISRHGRG